MVDDRGEVGVLIQLPQFGLDVAEIQVDGNRRQLETGEHAFHVLGAVHQLQSHVLTASDAQTAEYVCQTVRAFVEFGEGEPARRGDEYLSVRGRVDHDLEQVSEIEATHAYHRSTRGRPLRTGGVAG